MTKIPTYEYKEVEVKEDMPTIHDRNLLAELNNDSFVPKSFTSSRNKKQSQNIVIDLNSQTVTVPESDIKIPSDDSIINFDVRYNFFFNLFFLLLQDKTTLLFFPRAAFLLGGCAKFIIAYPHSSTESIIL